MNLAVIIGNYNYTQLKNLPACRFDCIAIHKILTASGKYQGLLFLDSMASCQEAWKRLESFFEEYRGIPVKEVFFYYSGHGGNRNGEFSYLWNDYDSDRAEETSLKNSDIDNILIRTKAELTVKVIDACRSGTPYVGKAHESPELRGHEYFGKCYFLFSSYDDQKSYSEFRFSYFTYSFCKALENDEPGNLLYKDLIHSISRDFSDVAIQNPFFVVQADFTDVFLYIDASLEKVIDQAWDTLIQGDPNLNIASYRRNGIEI